MAVARIDGTLKVKCDSAVCDVVATADSPDVTAGELAAQLRVTGWKFASGWHFCPATHTDPGVSR